MRLFVGYMAAEHDLVAGPYSVLLQEDLEAVAERSEHWAARNST